MPKAKLAVSLDEKTLREVDNLVARRIFPNRSRIIEEAIQEKLARMNRQRLARECALLDPAFEQALADEGMGAPVEDAPLTLDQRLALFDPAQHGGEVMVTHEALGAEKW